MYAASRHVFCPLKMFSFMVIKFDVVSIFLIFFSLLLKIVCSTLKMFSFMVIKFDVVSFFYPFFFTFKNCFLPLNKCFLFNSWISTLAFFSLTFFSFLLKIGFPYWNHRIPFSFRPLLFWHDEKEFLLLRVFNWFVNASKDKGN